MMPWPHRRLAAWIACLAIVLGALAPTLGATRGRDAGAVVLAAATCSANPAGHALPPPAFPEDTRPGQPGPPLPAPGTVGAHCPWCPWSPPHPGLASRVLAGVAVTPAASPVPRACAYTMRPHDDSRSPANPRAPPLDA